MHSTSSDLPARLRRLAGLFPRPASGVPGLTLAVAGFMAVFLNNAFWKAVIAAADISMARNLGFGVALAAPAPAGLWGPPYARGTRKVPKHTQFTPIQWYKLTHCSQLL